MPGLINVEVKAEYDYTGASNFDLVFADQELLASCSASGLSELACLGYQNINSVSESSSGPVMLSMGLPSTLQRAVIPVGSKSGMNEVPLLISISNEYSGKFVKINDLFLALPLGITPLQKGLCRFKGTVPCYDVFGKGLSGYTCYRFDSSFLNKKDITKMLMEGSINCVMDINQDVILEAGSKAVKNIKAYLDYSYMVSANVSMEYTVWDEISDDREEGTLKGTCKCIDEKLLYSYCLEGKLPSCKEDSCSCLEKTDGDEEGQQDEAQTIIEKSCACRDGELTEDNCGQGYTTDCLDDDVCGCVIDG